jgi:hypothetical protein
MFCTSNSENSSKGWRERNDLAIPLQQLRRQVCIEGGNCVLDFEKYFEDISEHDLKSAIESEKGNINTFLILTKMLCAKKGMTASEWEEIFHEKKMMQSLRQKGISEHFVKEIVAYIIQTVFGGINGKVSLFPSFDREGELTCSICPEKPYKVLTIGREDKGSEDRDALVVVLCKRHIKRIGIRHDVKLMHSITEYCRTQTEELKLI